MDNKIEKLPSKLPTLAEIESGDIELRGRQNELNVLLNNAPPKQWLKEHPMIKKGSKGIPYLPIDKVEYMLTKLFVDWWIKINTVQLIANSVVVTVTLYYINPIDGKTHSMDGIGAAGIQCNKGASPTDWSSLKHDGVAKAAPIAAAFAEKNAARKLGKLFGRDLTHEDEMDYTTLLGSDRFHKEAKNEDEYYTSEDIEEIIHPDA